jgi:hypothetical protein
MVYYDFARSLVLQIMIAIFLYQSKTATCFHRYHNRASISHQMYHMIDKKYYSLSSFQLMMSTRRNAPSKPVKQRAYSIEDMINEEANSGIVDRVKIISPDKSRSKPMRKYVPQKTKEDEPIEVDRLAKNNKPTSPWKQVIHKLESTSPSKNSMGKIGKTVENTTLNTLDELQCKHFDICGGCTVKGDFTSIPVVKKAQIFFATEGIKNLPIHIYDHIAWRSHVKLAVQPLSKWGGLKFGLYKPGSHTVESIPECRVHHPRINEALEVLRNEASALGVKGYQHGQERVDPSGELRYVQLSLERSTGKVQLVLVWNVVTYKEAEQTLPRLVKRLKSRADLFHSITANFQTSRGNAIFNFNAKNWKLLWGPPVLKEQVGEAMFSFRPQIFRQVHLLS